MTRSTAAGCAIPHDCGDGGGIASRAPAGSISLPGRRLIMQLPPGPEGQIEVGGRRLTLTSLDRLLWPDEGFTKRDLIAYYAAIAPAIVPQLAGRPLTMARFPHGVDGRGFLQNECRGAPPWL